MTEPALSLTDDPLGELLVRESLMTPAQLKTALEFQKSLGGDLRNIVVKLGYVKDSVLADLVAKEEHMGSASTEITEDMIDFDVLKELRAHNLLEKHQVVPLKSADESVVLAMADPNDLGALQEVQFVVNRAVEPAVATKAAIRKALNQLHDLIKKHEAKSPKTTIPADRLKALRELPLEKLLRAYVIAQIEAGRLTADDILARATKL